MEIINEKSKVIVNSTKIISVNITMRAETLEEVESFKYLGDTLYRNGTCTWRSESGSP